MEEAKGRTWVALAVSALVTVLVYHAGMIATVFFAVMARYQALQLPLYFAFLLLPLQVAYNRRGARDAVRIAALAFLMLLLLRVVTAVSVLRELTAGTGQIESALAPLPGILVPLVFVELVTAAVLIGGQLWLNVYSPVYVTWRTLYRILAATAVAAAAGLVTVVLLQTNSRFVEGIERLFANVAAMIQEGLANAIGEGAPEVRAIDPTQSVQVFWDYVITGFVFGYFVNLTGAWFLGNQWSDPRRFGRRPVLSYFKVPDTLVWPLIVSWALVGADWERSSERISSWPDQFVELGVIGSLALSAGMLFLFLFGLQGLSILRFLAARSDRLKDLRRFWFIGLLILMVFRPLVLLTLAGVALFGISEIWIEYRVERRGEKHEDHS
jgi:hypothetical protein